MTQNVSKRAGLKIIGHFIKSSLAFFIFSIVFSMLNTLFNSATPQIVKVTVDSVIGGKPFLLPDPLQFLISILNKLSFGQLLCASTISIIMMAALGGVSTYFSRTLLAKGSEKFVKLLRDHLFYHIQKLPFSWHVKNQTGEIIQRCTSDVDVIRNFVCNQMIEVFRTVFLIVLSLCIMFSMNVQITLIALIFVPVIVGYSAFFYSRIARRFRTADEAEGALSSAVQENLTGVRVVRAFGREKYEIERFDKKNEHFSNLWIHLGTLLSYYWGVGDFITGLQILAVIVAGTMFAVEGQITLGEFLAFVSYNSTLIWPVRGLGRILSEMSKAGVSIERVSDILLVPEEMDPPDAAKPDLYGDICFEHVHFSYEGQKPVLKDIDFTIPAGSTFAILGSTGSGKSTLMYLLDRLYDLPDSCGKITIGGVDIRHIKRSWLRQNIGMVLQEPFLFSRTIEENISASHPGTPLEKVRMAAKIACVDDAISLFSQGYDTIVGERGVTLSGGQKQRVAIARMLLQSAPIMIFDDSLSAVDAQTDSQIRSALQKYLKNTTTIIIAHRITTVMHADCILVMENGAIAEMGTHENLIARQGIYKSIYDVQMSRDDRDLLEEDSSYI